MAVVVVVTSANSRTGRATALGCDEVVEEIDAGDIRTDEQRAAGL